MSSFLEDIEFASKVSEAIKEAEQRGIDNSLELTKEMIKQQYGDIEKLQQENKQLKAKIDQIKDIYTSMQFSAPENYYLWIDKLGEILGDEE